MSYEQFMEVYNNLSPIKVNIVYGVLQRMEHRLTKDEYHDLDIKNSIGIEMMFQNLEVRDVIKMLRENSNEIANDENEEKDIYEKIQNSYYKMLERNSKRGLYKDVLKVLNITERDVIHHSIFYQEKMGDLEWLYNSLSEDNKEAIYYLAICLEDERIVQHMLDIISGKNIKKQYGVVENE